MAEISNPRYSRPIDVHRWSDHPEVKALVEEIWQDYLPWQITGKQGERRPGPQPKTSFKNQLRVLILDLYVAWLEDPELSIGMSMSPNEWNANSRYNALHLSKKLIPITEALSIAGLVDLAKGSYAGPGAKSNRTTRIRASEGLQNMFRDAKFQRDDVHRFDGQEVIILRDEKVAGKVGKEVEYTDTPNTNAMRSELKSYNDLLAASFIDIATLQEPIIPREDAVDGSLPVRIHPDHARLRRVFSRKDWSMNGRGDVPVDVEVCLKGGVAFPEP
ncbi:hypothetical protein [Phaeobacter sp. SYSU ZJ3003]|uniref:hypothetical protein n=1 Tax=Phaeobacter sp. SYSU ZJ3003 TaxID=2109330 RepID=UPI00351C5306